MLQSPIYNAYSSHRIYWSFKNLPFQFFVKYSTYYSKVFVHCFHMACFKVYVGKLLFNNLHLAKNYIDLVEVFIVACALNVLGTFSQKLLFFKEKNFHLVKLGRNLKPLVDDLFFKKPSKASNIQTLPLHQLCIQQEKKA